MKPRNRVLNRIGLLVLTMIIHSIGGYSQEGDTILSKQVTEIESLKEEIQKKVSGVLHIAKNLNEGNFDDASSSIEYVKVVNTNCGLYESQFDTDLAILNAGLNDEYQILEEEDDWFRVRLKDGREAWISRDCVQQVVVDNPRKSSRFKSADNRNDQLQLASYLIDETRLIVEIAQRKIAKRIKQKNLGSEEKVILIQASKKIKKYLALAESAYLLYIIPEEDKVTFAAFLSKVSFLAELQMGASDFTMVRNENNQISQKGAIGEFLLDLAYQLGDKSAIGLLLSSSRDIVQTPYSITTVDLNYKKTGRKLSWNSALSNTTYSDEINPFNNYNRLGFRIGGRHKLSKTTSYNINYNLNANRYSDFESIDFTNHLFNFASKTIINSSKSLNLDLRGNVQSGQESRRNFYLINPGIRYNVQTNKSMSQYFINYQRYKFVNLGLRDADRLMIGLKRTRQLKNRNRASSLSFSSKVFPSRPQFSYYQLDSRLSARWNKSKNIFTNSGLRINYFPENINQNFADIQFSFGTHGSLFYTFSTFNRLYYQIQPVTSISDVNLVSGLNIGGFRLGPSLSLHALINTEDLSFEKDGNFYRFGAYFEGNVNLPFQINLTLSASYDYGYVYSQQFEQNSTTGELSFGDFNVRNPTTFQLNTLLTTSIFTNTDLFLRLNTYIIDTDITSVISRDPFERNSRFILRLGAKYRFN